MRFLYNILCFLVVPFAVIRLFWLSRKVPTYRHRIAERFGFFQLPQQYQHAIWVHAVSVGEVIVAVPLIQALQEKLPNQRFIVTTMTPTGSERVRALLSDSVFHVYLPYDLPNVMKHFYEKVRPAMLIIIETELWPNLLYYAKKNKVPVVLANARKSEHSVKRYSRFQKATQSMLSYITLIAAQSQLDANRFIQLGASEKQVQVVGSIKFDKKLSQSVLEGRDALKTQLNGDRPVWIAGSTHAGEEEQVLLAHEIIKEKYPDALLILVPRHPERVNEILPICEQYHFKTVKRSENPQNYRAADVIYVDTLGELLQFYAVSQVAFVGGSLIKFGGHNLLEPALFKIPVISGPSLHDFSAVADVMKAADAVTIVEDGETLANAVLAFLKDPSAAKASGERAYQVVLDNRGALSRHVDLISQLLPVRS